MKGKTIDDPWCVSVERCAFLLGISRNVAYQMVRDGRIPSIRLGKRLLVPVAELEKLLQQK